MLLLLSELVFWLLLPYSQALQEALPGSDEEARGGPVSAGGHAAGCTGSLPHGRGAAAGRQ